MYVVAYYIVFAMRNEFSMVNSKKLRTFIIVFHCNAWSNYRYILFKHHVLRLTCIDENMFIIYR